MYQVNFEPDYFTETKHKGKKPKLYMVLDCETATMPFVKSMNLTEKQRQNVSIAMPLIYDLAWKVVDRNGLVYSQHSFLITETFFVPQVFSTAYYRDKRPQYEEKFAKGEIIEKSWNDAMKVFENDLQYVDCVTAYNAMFDFKKAIPFTNNYIYHLRQPNYQQWEDSQYKRACDIASKLGKKSNPDFDHDNFVYKKKKYPVACLWRAACEKLINNHTFKKQCIKTAQVTKSGLYFKTSAESTYRYLLENYNFEESHTAFEDVEIETIILQKILKKGKLTIGIDAPPFQLLGTVPDYLIETFSKRGKKPKYDYSDFCIVTQQIYKYIRDDASENLNRNFETRLERIVYQLEMFCKANFNEYDEYRFADTYGAELHRQIERKQKQLEKLKLEKRKQEIQKEIEFLQSQYDRCQKEMQKIRGF